MDNTIEFTRGDAAYHTFSIPASSWLPGGLLFFAAKQAIDDDTTDALAVINKSWDDDVVTDVVIDGVPYKQYACTFVPGDTSGIESDGADSLTYEGEFQYVGADGLPITFPPTSPKLQCIVYFDVKRKTTA